MSFSIAFAWVKVFLPVINNKKSIFLANRPLGMCY